MNLLTIICIDKFPSKHIQYFLELVDSKGLTIEFKEISDLCEKLLTQISCEDFGSGTSDSDGYCDAQHELKEGNRKLNVYEVGIIFEKLASRMIPTEKDKLLILLLSTSGKFSEFNPNLVYP